MIRMLKKIDFFGWLLCISIATTFFLIGVFSAYANTITVNDGDGIKVGDEKIRMYGVDAPELKQPGGVEARDWLTNAIVGRKLTIKRLGKDHYGRTIAIIFVSTPIVNKLGVNTSVNTSVNKALVLEGHAWAYREHAMLYVASEKAARTAQRGLWAPGLLSPGSCPQAPWHWREDH